ncbi:MAG TPA: hypothetical protein VJ792_04405 [Candidatus Nitrosotalea sp.]|nr:hypothetical protein [Candidatus Nitrosotalea sp.]
MSKSQEREKHGWTRLFGKESILPFLHGGLRQHRKIRTDKAGMGFGIKSTPLGVGMTQIFRLV